MRALINNTPSVAQTRMQLRLRWHPKYAIVPHPYEDAKILLSEADSLVLRGARLKDIDGLLRAPLSLLDIAQSSVNSDSDFFSHAVLLNAVERFRRRGIIVEVDDAESDLYTITDCSKPATFIETGTNGVTPVNLSQCICDELISRWAASLPFAMRLTLVVVDDYLDPRLIDLSSHFSRDKVSWIIIKPVGEHILIGPWFNPGRSSESRRRVCLHCLRNSLLRNQPLRHLAQLNSPGEYVALPVWYHPVSVTWQLSQITQPLCAFVNATRSARLIEIVADERQTITHELLQASACPHYYAQRIEYSLPVKLQKGTKLAHGDGGARTVSTRTTLKRLRKSVSPLTGIVHELSELPAGDTSIWQSNSTARVFSGVYRAYFYISPYAKRINPERYTRQWVLGKGISRNQARASAVCEALERYAAQFQGCEYKEKFSIAAIPGKFFLPQQLAAYADVQYVQFHAYPVMDDSSGYVVDKFHDGVALHWIKAWSLTDKSFYYIPFTYCYANTPLHDERYCRWNSNGNAAGNTLEEAVLQGLYELIERDAVAIWWYNRVRRPAVSRDIMPVKRRHRIEKRFNHQWDYWLLNLTHDLNIPVIVAVGRHIRSRELRVGFGCHLDPQTAAERALTELAQIISIDRQGARKTGFILQREEFCLFEDSSQPVVTRNDFCSVDYHDIRDDIEYCIEQLQVRGMQTLVYDYGRPETIVKTVKVIVPGLNHWWPQLANSRLYKVPVELHWQPVPNRQSDLNPTPFLL